MDVETNSAFANYGLHFKADPTKTNVTNTVLVGNPATAMLLGSTAAGYSVSATLGTIGDEFTLNPSTGVGSTSDTPVPQVETATAVGTITGSGNATINVTGALITGSPLVLSVAVLAADTAATWAGKVRNAMGLVPAITDIYTVGGASDSITLTKKAPITNNDGTLNIAIANGTCTGITEDTTSVNTTAGVAGVAFTNNTGDGKDFEGITLTALTDFYGLLIKVISGAVTVTDGTSTTGGLEAGTILLTAGTNIPFTDTLTVTAAGSGSEVQITYQGS